MEISKCWHVMALRQVNEDLAAISLGSVVFLQLGPKPGSLHPHERINSRVIVLAATEDLHRDRIFLKLAFQPFHRFLYDKPEERFQCFCSMEDLACEDFFQ